MKPALLGLALAVVLLTSGCTDLTETVYPEVTEDNFYRDRADIRAAFIRPYPHTSALYTNSGPWRLDVLTSDMQAWPQKGQHGYDGGQWIRLHRHTWTPEEPSIYETWRILYQGVGYTNGVINSLGSLDLTQPRYGYSVADTTSMMAEMRVMRAWYYLQIADYFGNAPLVEQVGGGESPPTRPREELMAYVEESLRANADQLMVKENPAAYGRITQAAAYAMLAKLYINSEAWIGEPRWQDAIDAIDVVMSGEVGEYSLDEHWQDPLAQNNNDVSEENIWVLEQDWGGNADDMWATKLHYSHNEIFGFGGYNGIVTLYEAFNSYEDSDLRKNQFLIGPQASNAGNTVYATEEYSGEPLVLVPYIARATEDSTSDMLSGEENSGARNIHYEATNTGDPMWASNDMVVYRLSDLYMMKAEALMHLNGGGANSEAVELVNSVRERAFAEEDWGEERYTPATMTMDTLLAERGREFISEGWRRQDLVRFDAYTSSWWDKEQSESHRRLFPIPSRVMANNPNLEQNPGY